MAQEKNTKFNLFDWMSNELEKGNVEKQEDEKENKSLAQNTMKKQGTNDSEPLDLNYLFDAEEKKSNEVKKEKKKSNEPQCICGESLIKMQAAQCYTGDGIVCDACGVSCSGAIKVYHCKNESSPKHFGGYDLCKKCVNKLLSDHTKVDDVENTSCSKDGVKYALRKDGSLVFYPTPNVVRGKQVFEEVLLRKSQYRPKNMEAIFDYNKKIVNQYKSGQCSFIQCADLAYAQHYPLLIKAEHIFLLITQAISVHVDKNAEALRYKYVNHEGKKTLLVRTGPSFIRGKRDNDWNGVIQNFVRQIDENTTKDVVELFNSDFSTSSLTEQIAAKITLMSTCKNYFDYRMCACVCGFPEISLGGNINDWILLKQKVTKLLNTKVTKRFGAKWSKSLLPILDRFIAAYKGDISMVFWNSMIYRGQWSYYTSGGAYGRGQRVKAYKKFISGWINTFFPYVGDNNSDNRWCFEPYSGDMNANKQYKGADISKELKSPLGTEPKDFPKGSASAPVDWLYDGETLKMKFEAGYMGFEQDKKSLQLTPTIGWSIYHV